MKTIKNLFSILTIIISLTFVSCENEAVDYSLLNQDEVTSILPILTTATVTNTVSTTAISGGTITSDGGYTVTARGIIFTT